MKVDIISIDDGLAAIALRSMLEYFGYSVAMHHVVTSKQLVQALPKITFFLNEIVGRYVTLSLRHPTN
ncbi:MAG: hypothetical protein PUP92_34825 [Rhizonema sp. PD38]|nr:hypothetical protein [Rhizonema sp. PD38]